MSNSTYSQSSFRNIITEIPGPKSSLLLEEEARFLAPGSQRVSGIAGIALSHGEGAIVQDADGNSYIDFVAGICVASLGHGNKALSEALSEQALKLSSGSFTTEVRVELLKRIASQTSKIGSGSLNKIQLYSGGSEAVESAIRLARAHTKKYEVISFWGGYHGKTGGALGLMGSNFKHGLGPMPPGLHLAPYPDQYRPPFSDPVAKTSTCIAHLESMIEVQTTGSIAAIIVEPIQGTAGNVIPPQDFLPEVRNIAHKYGALLIVDEMITGWGRTGSLFGQGMFNTEADIMVFGKGVANGYPVTGIVTSEKIVSDADPWSRPSFSSSSYGGSPLGAAAANAVTREIIEKNIHANSAKVGLALLGELKKLERFPFVGEVRGKGLMISIEFVEDKQSKKPLKKEDCEWIFKQCLNRGLLTMAYSPRVRINPPLVITEEQALDGASVLEDVLTLFENERYC